MKKLMVFFSVVGLCMIVALPASATSITFGGYGLNGGNGGGEFKIVSATDLGTLDPGKVQSYGWTTFCIEKDEYISLNGTYDVEISNSAKNGGVNVDGSGSDPLDVETAWLFYQYYTSNLSSFDDGSESYGINSNENAGLFQKALWMFEDEIADNSSNKYYALATGSSMDWSDTGPVVVMNLYSGDTYCQDQLGVVPDASIMLLLGPALISLGLLGRRRKKV